MPVLQPKRADRPCEPKMPVWSTKWQATWLIGLLIVIVARWCDRTTELAEKGLAAPRVGQLTSTTSGAVDRTAMAWLEKSAAAYARATSYEDAGRVVLSYKVDSKPTQDVGPIIVGLRIGPIVWA